MGEHPTICCRSDPQCRGVCNWGFWDWRLGSPSPHRGGGKELQDHPSPLSVNSLGWMRVPTPNRASGNLWREYFNPLDGFWLETDLRSRNSGKVDRVPLCVGVSSNGSLMCPS